MKYDPFRYSLKVWSTSVIAAPVLAFILYALFSKTGFAEFRDQPVTAIIPWTFFYILFQFLFSLPVWLFFWLIISIIIKTMSNSRDQRLLISLIGMLLTVGAFLFVFGQRALFEYKSVFCYLLYSNCFFIGAGAWYFDLTSVEN